MTAPTSRRMLALLAFAATVPAWSVLPAALSRRAAEFSQFTDQAVLELHVAHATRELHFLGPYSRFHWNHPGPFCFYLMAPLYALSGQASRSLWITTWLLNVACIAAMVWITGRAAGRTHAVIAFALLVLQTLRLGPDNLCDPWGPYIVVLPFELCLFSSAAIASGHPGWLPIAALAGSFVVQTNLSAGAATVAALVAGVGGGLLRASRTPRDVEMTPLEATFARFGAWISPAILALGASAVVWALPVIEQLRTYPGNLEKLVDFAAKSGPRYTLPEVLRAASEHLVAVLPFDASYRLHAGSSVVRAPGGLAAVGAPLVLASLPLTGWLAARRERPYGVSASVVVGSAAGALLLAGRRIQGPLMSYLFLYAAGVGTVAVVLLAAEIVERSPARAHDWVARRPGPVALSITTISVVAWFLARAEASDVPYFYGRPSAQIRPLADAVERHLRDEHVGNPVARMATADSWGMAAGVLLELYKRRVPFGVEREWRFMFGEWFGPRKNAPTFVVFGDARYEASARNVVGCTLIAQAGSTYVYSSPGAGAPNLPEGVPSDPCP